MTIKDQVKIIMAGLAVWAKQYGGAVHLAHDVPHLLKILGDNPGAPRAGVLVASEKPRNETYSDVEGRVDREIWVAISRGYTLEAYRGKSLIDGVAGGKPMFELLEAARDTLRGLRFDADAEPVPYYGGFELLTFEGVTLDSYRLKITIAADIGDNIDDPEIS